MFNFKDENSAIYKKGIIIIQLIIAIFIILTMVFDDTNYEFCFRLMWVIAVLLFACLEGTMEVVARRNKVGYLYYIGSIIFIYAILSMYFKYYR